jgi:hypothetical protein
MDCFAEPAIGRAFRATRWLAMTEEDGYRVQDRMDRYLPSHFGGRFSANAFGPSI